MYFIVFSIIAVLSAHHLRFGECQPSFTQEPPAIVYTYVSNSSKFSWDYNAGGLTVTNVELSLTKDLAIPFKLIARKPLGGTLQKTSSYGDRIDFTEKATFTLEDTKQSDSGIYECRVHFDEIDPGSLASKTELIVVVPPTITSKTSSPVVLNEGDSQTLFCVASGNPKPVYTWFKDSGPVQDQPTGNPNYIISSATKEHAGSYRCQASVSAGGLGPFNADYTVDVTVHYAPQGLTISPPSDVVNEGQNITLTCLADGVPTPSYSWKFNGKPFSGAQNNVVTILSAKVKDKGNYTCVASNSLGNGEATKVLNVQYAPKTTNFSTGTPNNAVLRGQKATLTCHADGYPSPSYVVQRDNQVLGQVTPGVVEINNIQLVEEDYTYSCEPSNLMGPGPRKETNILVQVPPSFPNNQQQLPLAKQTVTEGDNQTYSCSVDAKPRATILWLLNGQNVTDTSPYETQTTYLASPGNQKILRTQSHLKIKGVTWRQYGTFMCLGVNDAGEVNQTTELEVRHRPVVQTVKDHPMNVTVSRGSTVTFNCKAIGNPATVEYKWQFNGVDITGSGCTNCENTTYIKTANTLSDAGWYACLGRNNLGYGPPARAQLLINHKPEINRLDPILYTVNETNPVTMLCRADGVPVPEIKWTKSGNVVGYGEELKINKTSDADHGIYTCEARNIMGDDDRSIELTIQTRPIIVSSSPMATNVGAVPGDVKELTCTVKGRPPPVLSWKNEAGNILGPNSANVRSIKREAEHTILELVVDKIGDTFYCHAANLLGSDEQQYVIREIGKPDPPIDLGVVGIKVDNAVTVSVNVSWTPGYNGGRQQDFSVEYREVNSGSEEFVTEVVGRPTGNVYTVAGLKPLTVYEFKMRARNMLGESGETIVERLTTPASSKQPDRGTVKATRLSEDKTVVLVTWTIQDEKVTTVALEYRRYDKRWIVVTGATNLGREVTEFKVLNLQEDERYEFRLDMRRPGEIAPVYVYSNEVYPVVVPHPGGRGGSGLSTEEIIAIVAGVAGLLLILIVILCLCCCKRRKKSQGPDRVEMSQTSSYAAGGPNAVRVDNRRSYGMESVEDDPFIEAHFASVTSMMSANGKKKNTDSGVNLGFLSQDSFQHQPEMLLNPGSRLPRNGRMSQSTGELNVSSAYPARGPQRDFSTLPPYHEPPSFEEAMRQSGRKPKTRKSTGDLTNQSAYDGAAPGSGRHSGRRPRQTQAQPVDDPTDSSDTEPRYVPHRTAPPPPKFSRHPDGPGHASVDHTGHVMGPRVLPSSSAPRNGPVDPAVPYGMPQRKNKTKQRHKESDEPVVERLQPPPQMFGPPIWRDSYKGWPPPQYTPDDMSPLDPRDSLSLRPRPPSEDLDLDDPSNFPPHERPPDLPPPMAMFPSNRRMPNYHDDPDDGLPEPPVFLRDTYSLDDLGPRYNPPHNLPSPGRSRQPYINIHGQLVRPDSPVSDAYRGPESLRSSRNTLSPEPEMPPDHWQPRGSASDEPGQPEVNFVSYLV